MKNSIITGRDAATGIRYIRFGNGPRTLVVVPGLTLGYVTYTAELVAESFAGFTDEYTVYLFDIREEVPAGYTIADMGDDLVTAIRNLGLEDIYVYGCSMGGMQSIYISGTYPELVAKVVVASSACKANGTSNAVISNWISLAQAGRCHELTTDMGQRIYSPGFYEVNKSAFDMMADVLSETILARFINTASAIVDLNIADKAAAITCPVLVIGSRGDHVLTGEASEEIAEITDGELYLYGEEQPHAAYDEVPGFKNRVLEFFR